MTWHASIAIAILTGAVGLLVGGIVEFALRHRGRPVVVENDGARHERFTEVVVLPGERALLVHVAGSDGDAGSCHLVRAVVDMELDTSAGDE